MGSFRSKPGHEAVNICEQAGRDHQEDRWNEQQGHRELDLGRGPGSLLLDPAALNAFLVGEGVRVTELGPYRRDLEQLVLEAVAHK